MKKIVVLITPLIAIQTSSYAMENTVPVEITVKRRVDRTFGSATGPERFVRLFEQAKEMVIPQEVSTLHLFLRECTTLVDTHNTPGRLNSFFVGLYDSNQEKIKAHVLQYEKEFFEDLGSVDGEILYVFGHELCHLLQQLKLTKKSNHTSQREKELEADTMSAKKLGCAGAAVSHNLKMLEYSQFHKPNITLNTKFKYHPSCAQRIIKLAKIAEKQKREKLGKNQELEVLCTECCTGVVLRALRSQNICKNPDLPDELQEHDTEIRKAVILKLYNKIANDKIDPLPKNAEELSTLFNKSVSCEIEKLRKLSNP